MEENVLTVLSLGSGSSGNSMYMEINGKGILIDMGVRYRRLAGALQENDRSLEDIQLGFLTHAHYDHTLAYPVLKKHTDARLFSSKRTRDKVDGRRFRGLEYDRKTEVDEGFYVTLFETSHDCGGSCGFVFDYGDWKIGYATDLGTLTDEIIEHLKGSDLVVLESNHDEEMLAKGPYPYPLKKRIASVNGHLSNTECAKGLRTLYENGTKKFLLAHLSKENNTPEKAFEEACLALDGCEADIRVLSADVMEVIVYRKSYKESRDDDFLP